MTEGEPGGPAEAVGVETRDIITAVGDAEVEGSGDLLGVLRDYDPGGPGGRDGEGLRVEARLGGRGG